jgi:DNA-binding transcriptional LysR family regulator
MPLSRGKAYKELRLSQLKAFCATATHKSFSAAARALESSQPTVWEQVRALERDFGATLLLRRGRELVLTEEGRVLLELAGPIVAGVDSLQGVFAERRGEVSRGLVVAGATSVFIEELAAAIVAFCRQHPQVRTALLAAPNAQVVEAVLAGTADAGVVQFGRLEAASPQIVTELLCRRPWALMAPRDHPLARKRPLRLADVVRHPLILEGQEFPWRRQLDEVFRQHGLLDRVQVVLEVNNSLAARRYVNLGLGVTILPEPSDGLAFPNLVVRPLGDLLPPEQVVVLWRRGATPRPQARLFIDFVRRHLGGDGPPARG